MFRFQNPQPSWEMHSEVMMQLAIVSPSALYWWRVSPGHLWDWMLQELCQICSWIHLRVNSGGHGLCFLVDKEEERLWLHEVFHSATCLTESLAASLVLAWDVTKAGPMMVGLSTYSASLTVRPQPCKLWLTCIKRLLRDNMRNVGTVRIHTRCSLSYVLFLNSFLQKFTFIFKFLLGV